MTPAIGALPIPGIVQTPPPIEVEGVVEAEDRLAVRDDEGKAARHRHRCERDDERVHIEVGDRKAVEQTAGKPDQYSNANRAAGIGTPACKTSPVMTPDSATTEPEERSMPPVMMTKVCPQATTAISDVATRIAMMFDDDRKVEVLVSDR